MRRLVGEEGIVTVNINEEVEPRTDDIMSANENEKKGH